MIQETVENNQSIWDLAIYYYGSYNAIKQLLLDNPDNLNLNNNVIAGSKININPDMVIDQSIIDYLKNKGLIPTTGFYDSTANGHGDFNNDFNNDFN